MKSKIGQMVLFAATLILAAGCAIPFDVETVKKTIDLPNTGGTYFDKVVDIPEEARKAGVSFETVSLSYTIRKDSGFAAKVKLYASPDQATHAVKPDNAEELLDENLALADTEKSGTVESLTIRDVLNAKQESFIIGAENFSISPLSTISIDITLRLKGKFGLF